MFAKRHTLFPALLAVSIAFSASSGALAQPTLSGDLSDESVVRLAIENSPALAAARAQTQGGEAKVREAESGFYPKVDASLSWTRIKESQSMTIPGMGTIELASEQTWKAAIGFQQVIYSGGSLQASARASRFSLDSLNAQSKRTAQAVANGARKSFYELQRSRAKQTVAEEALALAGEHLKQVQAFFDNGLVAKNEVLRVQVSLSNSELDLIRAKNGVDVGWSALERAVGIPLKSRGATLPEPNENTLPNFPLPGDPTSLALASRPEIQAFKSSREAALAVAAAAAGQARPQVALTGEINATDDTFFPENDDWRITLAAQWRLYDAGEIQSKVDQARAQADELLARLDDLDRQIVLEVSTAELNLNSARQRVLVANDQVASAEEDYRIALKRYSAQVGTNIDVLDARLALNNARISLVDAVYDALGAYADLRYALGDETF